jgi:hypothetical protein
VTWRVRTSESVSFDPLIALSEGRLVFLDEVGTVNGLLDGVAKSACSAVLP